MKKKVALLTGATGQDASYLAELLLEKDYEVHGLMRRASVFTTERIDHLGSMIHLHYGDLTDSSNLNKIIRQIKPDEVYNLGAQSHVQVSFEVPEYTAEVDAIGTLRLLEAVRMEDPSCKFYQASTSELYGEVLAIPQNETTPFNPRSPYAIAKQYAYWIVKNYREAYNLFACNGILFNHESPRRGRTFVSMKIVEAASKIMRLEQDCLYLGNLNAMRDWGYAPEYVDSMWRMLNKQRTPDDYVIATGEVHSVREFVQEVFGHHLGPDLHVHWHGEGVEEYGEVEGKVLVRVDPKYFRPTEVELLCGDFTKAYEKLGWKPKVKFKELVSIMVESEENKYEQS